MVMEDVMVTVTSEVMEILCGASIIHVVAQLKMRAVDNHNQFKIL